MIVRTKRLGHPPTTYELDEELAPNSVSPSAYREAQAVEDKLISIIDAHQTIEEHFLP